MKSMFFVIALVSLTKTYALADVLAVCTVQGKPYTLKAVTADNSQQEPFGGIEQREAQLPYGLKAVYLVGVGYGGNNHTLRIEKNHNVLAQDQQYGVNNKVDFNGDRLNLRINIFVNKNSIYCTGK